MGRVFARFFQRRKRVRCGQLGTNIVLIRSRSFGLVLPPCAKRCSTTPNIWRICTVLVDPRRVCCRHFTLNSLQRHHH